MQTLHIVVGTVTGTAKSIADYLAKHLADHFDVRVHDYPDLDEIIVADNQLMVFCVSNTGVGELPPSMRKVFVQLTAQGRSLRSHRHLIINLGDSSFKTFAKSGKTLEAALEQCGSRKLEEMLVVDAMTERYPRQAAQRWLEATLQKHQLL